MVMPTGEHCRKKNTNVLAHRGLEPATFRPLDSKSNALPTALPRKICDVGFKHCTVRRYSIATKLHVIASCMHNNLI